MDEIAPEPPPGFMWYPKQYLGDDKVLQMDWDTRGMHVHLLNIAWQQSPRGTLPDDPDAIKRWLSSPEDHVWRRVYPQLLAAWPLRDGRRVNAGLVRAVERQRIKSQAGKLGGNPALRKGQTNPYYDNQHDKQTHKHPLKLLPLESERANEGESPPDPGGGLPRGGPCPGAERPSWAEVKAYAAVIGLGEWRARDWLEEMEGCGWLDHNKRPIAKWQAVLNRVKTKWEADGRPSGPPISKRSPAAQQRPMTAMELKTIIAAKGVIADKLKNAHCSETGLGSTWNNDEARKQWKQLRAEIRDLNEKLAGLA